MIIRNKKDKDYTVMNNYHFRDTNLSLRAKGLLSLMLSLPNDWNFSINGLCKICNESRTTISNTLKELRDKSYIVVFEVRDGNGKFNYEYIVYENPNFSDPGTH